MTQSLIKSGVTVTATGTYQVTQNSTSPTSGSVVWAVDTQGNSLSTKAVGNGGTATWTGVLLSLYTTKVHRNGSANCNGIGFCDGSYNWQYTVTCTS